VIDHDVTSERPTMSRQRAKAKRRRDDGIMADNVLRAATVIDLQAARR
jgi:hypothetical protein